MPRLDPAATLRLHDVVNAATLAWTPDMLEGPVRAYVEKHGAAHLLSADRVDDARARLADPAYMAAFAEAWDSEVQPLAAWRVVGEAAVESALLERCAERVPVGAAAGAPCTHRHRCPDARDLATVADFLDAAGRPEAALVLACRVITGAGEPEDLLRALLRIAALEERLGREGARLRVEEALCAADDALGPDHPVTRLALTHAVQAALRDHDLARAEVLALRDVATSERVDGLDHPDTWTARSHLAAVLRRQDRLDEALALGEAVFEARLTALGEAHPRTLVAMSNLALLRRYDGDEEGAVALLTRAVEVNGRLVGDAHPATLTARVNLCAALRDIGRPEDALRCCGDAMAAAGRAQGVREIVHTLRMHGAMALADLERFGEAAAELEGLLRDRALDGPDDDPDTLTVRYKLASVLAQSGEVALAEGHLRAVMEARSARLGAWHRQTRIARESVCELLEEDGRPAESLPLRKADAEEDVRAGDLDSADAIARAYALGRVLYALDREAEALPWFLRVLDGETRLHGPDGSELALTHWQIAKCLRALDQPAEAARHRRRCWELESARDGTAASAPLQTAMSLIDDLLMADDGDAARAVGAEALAAVAEHAEPDEDDDDEERAAWIEALRDLMQADDGSDDGP